MTARIFEKVATRSTKHGTCPVCGKQVEISRTFWETVDPFNRNRDGSVRTRAQAWELVDAAAAAWQPDFTHAGCRR